MIDLKRIETFNELVAINHKFLNFFKDYGLIKHTSEKISSGIDPTVRFIGSHTTVLKQYIENDSLPVEGFCIIQGCLKTKNLSIFNNDHHHIYFGSYFPCQGILAHYSKLDKVVSYTLSYIYKILNIPYENIEIWANSNDKDLLESIKNLAKLQLDHLPPEKYIHKFGMDNISGRNINIAIKNTKTGIQQYFAVIIVIEKLFEPMYVEVAISPTIILNQIYSLKHILDCYPIPKFSLEESILSRKLEDCIMTITILYREGLFPSNHHNRNRILKRYLVAFDYIRKKLDISDIMLSTILSEYEKAYFGENSEVANQIIKYLASSI